MNSQINKWLSEPLTAEIKQNITRLLRLPGLVRLAITPDIHLAEKVCNGIALATSDMIYPEAVGKDIGCGMSTVQFSLNARAVSEKNKIELLKELGKRIPFIRHKSINQSPGIPDQLLQSLKESTIPTSAIADAQLEFGTIGRGNHFVEFQADADGMIWVLVHSGSRSLGHAILGRALQSAEKKGVLYGIHAANEAGIEYMKNAELAEQYASENRIQILHVIEQIIQDKYGVSAESQTIINSNHNHLHKESHFGKELLVHRKGAAKAFDGTRGVIPGSMGDDTFHTIGRGNVDALCSSSHGAGRKLTRTQARKSISLKRLKSELQTTVVDEHLLPRFIEEAPSVYRKISTVMRAQKKLVKTVRRLTPLITFRAP